MKIEEIKKDIKNIFSVDMTPDISDNFVEGLFNSISIDENQSIETQVKKNIGEKYYELSKDIYGPLIVKFTDWVLTSYSQMNKKGNVIFLARDAIPFYHIAHKLIEEKNYYNISKENIKKIFYTRKLVGDSDEIAGFKHKKTSKEKIIQYLKQEGVNQDSIMVDMGVYGSLYNKGSQEYWKMEDRPNIVFLYSKNPNILGFLNNFWTKSESPLTNKQKNLANIILDSGECVNPQKYWSPGEFIEQSNIIQPKLEIIENEYIQNWFKKSIEGYVAATEIYLKNPQINIDYELKKIEDLSNIAKKGVWTGVLPYSTPEWSLKDLFLNNHNKYKDETGHEGWIAKNAPPMGKSEKKYFDVI